MLSRVACTSHWFPHTMHFRYPGTGVSSNGIVDGELHMVHLVTSRSSLTKSLHACSIQRTRLGLTKPGPWVKEPLGKNGGWPCTEWSGYVVRFLRHGPPHECGPRIDPRIPRGRGNHTMVISVIHGRRAQNLTRIFSQWGRLPASRPSRLQRSHRDIRGGPAVVKSSTTLLDAAPDRRCSFSSSGGARTSFF